MSHDRGINQLKPLWHTPRSGFMHVSDGKHSVSVQAQHSGNCRSFSSSSGIKKSHLSGESFECGYLISLQLGWFLDLGTYSISAGVPPSRYLWVTDLNVHSTQTPPCPKASVEPFQRILTALALERVNFLSVAIRCKFIAKMHCKANCAALVNFVTV